MRIWLAILLTAAALITLAYLAPNGREPGAAPGGEATALPESVRVREVAQPEGIDLGEPSAPGTHRVPSARDEHAVTVEVLGPDHETTLVVRTVASDTGRLLHGTRVSVHPVRGKRGERWHGPGVVRRTTSAEGLLEYPVPAGKRLCVFAEGDEIAVGLVHLDVRALPRGVRRELELRVPVGGLRYYGRVFDRETRAPVPGASIAVSHDGSSLRAGEGGEALLSDEAGYFEVWASARCEGWSFLIEAEGRGPVSGSLESGHDSRESAQVFRLSRAASIAGRVTDALGVPLVEREVIAAAALEALRQPIPAFGSFNCEHPPRWKTTTDESGAYSLTGLPPDVELRLEVVRGTDQPPERRHLSLLPGEQRKLDVVVPSCVTLRGLMLDSENKPQPETEIAIEGDAGVLVAPAVTDGDGRFLFPAVPSGRCRIGPLRWIDDLQNGPAGITVDLRPEPRKQDIVVRLDQGAHLRGRVEALDGSPLRAFVSARGERGYEESCKTRRGGAFSLGPLMGDEVLLKAGLRRDLFGAVEQRVAAGAQDVVVRLPGLTGAIQGEFTESRTSPVRPHNEWTRNADKEIRLFAFRSEAGEFAEEELTRDRGDFAFLDLPPDTYDLVAATAQGTWGCVRGVVVSAGEISFVEVDLQPATTVRVVYRGQSPSAIARATLDGLPVAGETVFSGTSAVLVVPPGHLVIDVVPLDPRTGGAGGEVRSRRALAVVGEECEVVFP